MKIKILESKAKPFTGKEGNLIPWYWYEAEAAEEGAGLEKGERFQFGSKQGDHEGETELNIVRTQFSNGNTGFKELF